MVKKQELSCHSWKELVDKIKEARQILGNPKIVWYRGQSNSTYELVPSLMRQSTNLAREKEAFTIFKKLANRLSLDLKGVSDWELLFAMQHYGIPTRLLDWSEVLGVSLFFATQYSSEADNEISLFILDPLKLNKLSAKQDVINLPAPGGSFEYESIYLRKEPVSTNHPIAISPNYSNNRLLAQKGMFTIHPDSSKSLEELCSNCIVKIIITNEAIPEIQDFLEMANLNAMSIFPDMEGAAKYIKNLIEKP